MDTRGRPKAWMLVALASWMGLCLIAGTSALPDVSRRAELTVSSPGATAPSGPGPSPSPDQRGWDVPDPSADADPGSSTAVPDTETGAADAEPHRSTATAGQQAPPGPPAVTEAAPPPTVAVARPAAPAARPERVDLAAPVDPVHVDLPGGATVEFHASMSMHGSDLVVGGVGLGADYHWRSEHPSPAVVEMHSIVEAKAWRVVGRLDGSTISTTVTPIAYRPGVPTPLGQTNLPFSDVGSVGVCVSPTEWRVCSVGLQPGWHVGSFPHPSETHRRVTIIRDDTGASFTVEAGFNPHGEAFARIVDS